MDLDFIIRICYIAIPAAIAGISILIKVTITNRLNKLEDQATTYVTKEELRQTLADKIEPMKEDLSEIKQQLVKVYDLLLKR